MFRTIQGAIALTVALVISAVIAAAAAGKLTNVLIGAAMVASNAVLFYFILAKMMERHLGDAYEEGRGAGVKSLIRDLVAVVNESRN